MSHDRFLFGVLLYAICILTQIPVHGQNTTYLSADGDNYFILMSNNKAKLQFELGTADSVGTETVDCTYRKTENVLELIVVYYSCQLSFFFDVRDADSYIFTGIATPNSAEDESEFDRFGVPCFDDPILYLGENTIFYTQASLYKTEFDMMLQEGDTQLACYLLEKHLLNKLDTAQLALVRNFFYAVHGYDFATPKLKKFFGQFSWYEPITKDVEDQLALHEKIYIEKILRREGKSGSLLQPDDFHAMLTTYTWSCYHTGTLGGPVDFFKFRADGTFIFESYGNIGDQLTTVDIEAHTAELNSSDDFSITCRGKWKLDGTRLFVQPNSVDYAIDGYGTKTNAAVVADQAKAWLDIGDLRHFSSSLYDLSGYARLVLDPNIYSLHFKVKKDNSVAVSVEYHYADFSDRFIDIKSISDIIQKFENPDYYLR